MVPKRKKSKGMTGLNPAIKDEKEAVPMYQKLKKKATTKDAKKKFAKIIKDEKKHRRWLEKMQ